MLAEPDTVATCQVAENGRASATEGESGEAGEGEGKELASTDTKRAEDPRFRQV